MTLRQPAVSGWNRVSTSAVDPYARAPVAQSPWVERLRYFWLVGLFVLLPMDLSRLPFGIRPVDIWISIGLPLAWLSLSRGLRVVNLTYAVAMWLILTSSFASALVAPSPRNALVVIMKEVYILVWFVTLAAVFSALNAKDHRRVLSVWSGMVFLHGFVLVGQFFSPGFWHFIVGLTGKPPGYEFYRPAGLFLNANSAAFFQLLGFVPLMLVSRSRAIGATLALLLLTTMLLTGSMGAAIAFSVGCLAAITVIVLRGHLFLILRTLVQVVIVVSLLSGLLYFVISHNARYQEHFAHIFLGRAERSSGGRFNIWQRGIATFVEYDAYLYGVGPENFRVVDPQGKQLHNDVIAFTVERGLFATLGLAVFGLVAMSRAIALVLISDRGRDRSRLVVVVFVGAVVATLVESATHQVFHFRELWMVLALLEATIFRMTRSGHGGAPDARPQLGA